MVQAAKQTLNSTDHSNATEVGPLSHSKIVALNRKIRKNLREMRRIENKYDTTLQDALQAEDVILCQSAEQWGDRLGSENAPQTGFAKCQNAISKPFVIAFYKLETTGYFWYTRVEQIIYLIFGIIFSIFSVIVFLAEILTFDDVRILDITNLMKQGDSFVKSQVINILKGIH